MWLRTFIIVVLTAGILRAEDDVPATFTYTDPEAKNVEVAGEFSNWKMLPLTKDSAGNWTKTLHLKPGTYAYKFIINGEWKFDPKNPARKTVNDIENSSITVGAVSSNTAGNVTFTFAAPNAQAVFVAGEFNQWNATATPLQKGASGMWTVALNLKPGKYQYKFIVDGNWQTDPAGAELADDGLGGKNSVKVVNP